MFNFHPTQSTRYVMPQHTRYHDQATGRSFWKLVDYSDLCSQQLKQILSERGVYFSTNSQLNRLRELLQRADRQLLSYERCSVAELRKFTQQRNLALLPSSKKAELVKALKEADEAQSFKNFAELPAELRGRIYGMYIEGFNGLGYFRTPEQPPTACVSRQLRHEFLPVFYGSCKFLVCVELDNRMRRRFGLPKFDSDLLAWLHRTNNASIWDIANLSIRVKSEYNTSYPMRWDCDISIDLKRSRYTITTIRADGGAPYEILSKTRYFELLEGRVPEVLDTVMTRSGPNKLRKKDFEFLRKALDLHRADARDRSQ